MDDYDDWEQAAEAGVRPSCLFLDSFLQGIVLLAFLGPHGAAHSCAEGL
jgi:hypothetical protein